MPVEGPAIQKDRISKREFRRGLLIHNSDSQKGLSVTMELNLLKDHFKGVRDTCLLITFSFLIAEMVA